MYFLTQPKQDTTRISCLIYSYEYTNPIMLVNINIAKTTDVKWRTFEI